ncbi:MAG: hypothetical protein ACR2HC_02845 [Thermoleophilaceae bacterium]
MRRATATTLSVTALVALPLAGCGQSDKDKYVNDYKPLNDKLLTLGDDLGKAVSGAGSESNSQLATRFTKLGTRFKTLRSDISGLETPGDLKDESKGLTSALGSTQKDVEAIAAAAKGSDPSAARSASMKLVADAQKVNTTQNTLAKATGAKVGKK